VSFAAITLCVASQRVFILVISLSTQSGIFWLYPRTSMLFVHEEAVKYSFVDAKKGRSILFTSATFFSAVKSLLM
jgi:hypothetical protein